MMTSKYTSPTLILFIIFLGFTLYMSFRLLQMAQISGWIPGATTITHKVTQTYNQPPWLLNPSNAYWVSWSDDVNVRRPGNHRIKVPKEKFKTYYLGAPIEIVYIGNGSTPYLRDGLVTSDSNFLITSILANVGLIGAVIMGVAFVLPEEEKNNAEASRVARATYR